jgi:hypothetical protein
LGLVGDLAAFGVVRFGVGDELAFGFGAVVAGAGEEGSGEGGSGSDGAVVAGTTAASGTSAARGSGVWASACRDRPTTVNPEPITTAVAPATNV